MDAVTAKLLLAIVLAPVAAAYDFMTNPNAPPAIFIAQWNGSFPNHPIAPPVIPRPRVHKHVTVTRT
jgi:hypothetical protein